MPEAGRVVGLMPLIKEAPKSLELFNRISSCSNCFSLPFSEEMAPVVDQYRTLSKSSGRSASGIPARRTRLSIFSRGEPLLHHLRNCKRSLLWVASFALDLVTWEQVSVSVDSRFCPFSSHFQNCEPHNPHPSSLN